ncbi:MAG TPA: hypothetical protein DEV81_08500 [Cyanobacteria bacterium UBA11049]|nr:hypothetical protein [Cyanobacteria bacterium UBA11049]
MEPGLRILIQLVLEFAPAIAALVQKRSSAIATIKDIPFKEIQEFIQMVSGLIPASNSPGEFEQTKLLQQQLAVYYRETQFKLAEQERETALKLPEVNKILESWPLRLYPSQILETHTNKGRIPLRIFIAPPQIKFDKFTQSNEESYDIELMLAEGLREFLNKHYSLHSQVRPTELLAGAWESKRFHSESSIKALFGMLKSEPTLILESEIDGDYLNFRVAYWGFGQDNYYYKTICRLPYKQIAYESAKSRALEWRTIREQLLLLGESLEDINKIAGDNILNLEILEKAELWQAKGIDVSKLSLQYQVNRQDFEQLCSFAIAIHCSVAGWVADAYHLIYHDVPPLLPELLPSLLKDTLDMQAVQAIATGYKQIYQALEDERRYWVPELALQLAESLAHLPDRSWSQEQVYYSLDQWLQLRQVIVAQGSNPLEAMQSALSVEDEEYLQHLKSHFVVLGDSQSVTQIERNLSAIAELKLKRQLEYATVARSLTEHTDRITAVAISPDGQTLVSGSNDKTIKIWQLNTGKLIRSFKGDSGAISSVAISADGNFLAAGSHDTPKSNVKVWNLKTGNLIHTLLGHHKPVNSIAISPDAQILASASNKIKIWHLHKGDRLCTLWHSYTVNSAAISPDSSILASGSSDSKIRLWNPLSGELLRTLTGHSDEVKSVAISPDGQTLISGSADTRIKIWRLSTGKLLHTLTGHSAQVNSVAISPDGETLISGSADTSIKIWCLNTAKLKHTLTGHLDAVNSVAISPDGQILISGSADKTIKIWRVV